MMVFMKITRLRENAMRAALLACSTLLATTYFTGCGQAADLGGVETPTTVEIPTTVTKPVVEPEEKIEFDEISLRLYLNHKVLVDTSGALNYFMPSNMFGDDLIGDKMQLYSCLELDPVQMKAGYDAQGNVVGYLEDKFGYAIDSVTEYRLEQYSIDARAFMSGGEHDYWYAGKYALERQNADAASGRRAVPSFKG